MRKLSTHAEWLRLVEISGPFLSTTMLERAFPQGLEAIDTPRKQMLRSAYEEWQDAVDENDPQLDELHREWVRLVLEDILEYDREVLVGRDTFGSKFSFKTPESPVTFIPDLAVKISGDERPRLFISIHPPGTDLEKAKSNDGWPIPVVERMTLLCRSAGVRLGLVTNGERWMLVNAPLGSTSSHTSWYSRLWFQEPITLKAFLSLFGVRRCFGPTDETLDALLEESLKQQEEVTDTLGEQVRRAVEVLVQCLDKADQDRNRELLHDVSPSELYEAGLTIMMRLVFVLCAEERGLLLMDDPIYDQYYSISALRSQLAEEADRHGPEVLDRRHDAWARLLAVFRAIYGGIEHEMLRMPALGGSLFDPDRFPFLEGRAKDTKWRYVPATPLPIDNRTVLLLLEALQVLEQPGGALLLSYKALDVENIGHVYEGLLEHTVARVPEVTLGLIGSQKAKNPIITLRELEEASASGELVLRKLLLDVTHRSESAILNGLNKNSDDSISGRVLTVCGGDVELSSRIMFFANLLRTDAWGDPIVYKAKSFTVTIGANRRETGTHYTPKSLTETIVSTTLEPIVYIGPAEGKSREEWKLKTPAEILDLKVCDPAMGSGAFLVQACRFISEKLVESWNEQERIGMFVSTEGEVVDRLADKDPIPTDLEDRLMVAKRLVAERCIYGVDLNPMAVELGKLSIWLITMARGYPFGFLDHNLKCGDSLLGIHDINQLIELRLKPSGERQQRLFGQNIQIAVNKAMLLRHQMRKIPLRDIRDVEAMESLNGEVCNELRLAERLADCFIGVIFAADTPREAERNLHNISLYADKSVGGDAGADSNLNQLLTRNLAKDALDNKPRRPFHWALSFPEVFARDKGGFDAIVGNPPFLGGVRISEINGDSYNGYLTKIHSSTSKKTDLCAHFFRRSYKLLREKGIFGLLATNTIAQGTTRKGGLTVLIDQGCSIIQANPSFVWPGKASVIASHVTIAKFKWTGKRYVSGNICNFIGDLLTPEMSDEASPVQLIANNNLCHQGSSILGMGFFLDPNEATRLLETQFDMADVVKPVMGGKELNDSPDFTPPRWIIDMYERDEIEARHYKAAFKHLELHVKPERLLKDSDKYPRLVETWWKFWHSRGELYGGIKRLALDRVLTRARVSDHHMMAFLPPDIVYTEQLAVFLLDKWSDFSILQSIFHECWARRYASTLKTDVRYIPTDCFGTFPFPMANTNINNIGKKYYEYRSDLMKSSSQGMTKLYNKYHNNKEYSEEISKLRSLHIEMDQAVGNAYGWSDLNLDHSFYETDKGIRFTVSSSTRSEIINRLLRINNDLSGTTL